MLTKEEIQEAELNGRQATLNALDAELVKLRAALAEAKKTQPLPPIWVQIPFCATAVEYGVEDTWYHVPCQRYFQSAMHHDCQTTNPRESR